MPKHKVGSIRTFKNGARAKVLPSGKLKIISGPTSGVGSKRKGKMKKKGGSVAVGGGFMTYG